MPSKATLAIEWPVFQPRSWGKPANARPMPRPWFGLDTERDAKSGEFVCGWTVGETVQSFLKITDLLPATYWVWNLAYDIEGMLRDLRQEEAWAAKSDGSLFPILGGNAVYYHGKRFDLKIEKQKWHFIEAASFFGRRPLSAMGSKEGVDASQMSILQYQTQNDYRDLVDSYCRQDARIVYESITTLNDGLMKLGVDIGGTPGATARRFIARLGQFPPVIWQTHKAFLRSYCGGRFEITKRGILHEAKQADIVSAYPWALAQCPWLTEGAYARQTRRFSDDALYGTYNVSFHYDNYLGVAPTWKHGVRVYSKRENDCWLTRPEIEFLRKRGCEVTIWRGVEIFDTGATDLWKQIIGELFQVKQRTKNATDKGWGAKIILNSQYGILIQLIRRAGRWVRISEAKNPIDFAGTLALEEPPKEFEGGKYFAPVYAGHLTALTRVKLLEAAEKIGPEKYAGGHTDSVLYTGNVDLSFSGELGGWELKDESPRVDLCKTGMYAIGDTVKFRGITRKGKASDLWEDYSTRKCRIGIKSASSWNDVSVIVPKIVANNYTVENKRLWHGEVTRGLIALERYIDSEALEMVNG